MHHKSSNELIEWSVSHLLVLSCDMNAWKFLTNILESSCTLVECDVTLSSSAMCICCWFCLRIAKNKSGSFLFWHAIRVTVISMFPCNTTNQPTRQLVTLISDASTGGVTRGVPPGRVVEARGNVQHDEHRWSNKKATTYSGTCKNIPSETARVTGFICILQFGISTLDTFQGLFISVCFE